MTWYKRIYDLGAVFILGAFILLPFAALLIYLLIKQGRPIFYVAERMRAPGRSFMLWKLRTMTVVAENPGVSGGDKAARVTPMGRFLRRTRADDNARVPTGHTGPGFAPGFVVEIRMP